MDALLFLNYPQRRPTRQEHIERIRQYLGLRPFIESDRDGVKAFVDEQVRAGARPHELLPDTERMIRQQHIVLPGVTVLEKLIATARAESEEKLFQEIASRAGEDVMSDLVPRCRNRELREFVQTRYLDDLQYFITVFNATVGILEAWLRD